jgi:hypothetical protein
MWLSMFAITLAAAICFSVTAHMMQNNQYFQH